MEHFKVVRVHVDLWVREDRTKGETGRIHLVPFSEEAGEMMEAMWTGAFPRLTDKGFSFRLSSVNNDVSEDWTPALRFPANYPQSEMFIIKNELNKLVDVWVNT
jgi:hypothetical protein